MAAENFPSSYDTFHHQPLYHLIVIACLRVSSYSKNVVHFHKISVFLEPITTATPPTPPHQPCFCFKSFKKYADTHLRISSLDIGQVGNLFPHLTATSSASVRSMFDLLTLDPLLVVRRSLRSRICWLETMVRRACSSDSRFKGLLLASSHRYLYISFALSDNKVANNELKPA